MKHSREIITAFLFFASLFFASAATCPLYAQEGPLLQVSVLAGQLKVTEEGVSRLVATIPSGTYLWPVETNGNFYRVYDHKSGKTGWIWNQHASPVQLSDRDDSRLATATDQETEGHRLLNEEDKYEQARLLFDQALRTHRDILPALHPYNSSLVNAIGACFDYLAEYDKAENYYRDALKSRLAMLGPDHADTVQTTRNLASVLDVTGRTDAAEKHYRKALDTCLEVFGTADEATAIAAHELALFYDNNDKDEKAVPFYQQALESHQAVFGTQHEDTARVLHNLASVYDEIDRDSDAEARYRQALEIRTRVLGEKDIDTAATLEGLAIVYDDMKRFSDAAGLYRKVVAIRTELLGEDHEDTALAVENLALNHDSQDDDRTAVTLYRKALRMRIGIHGEENTLVADTMASLGMVHGELHEYERGVELLTRALEIRRGLLEGDHVDVADNLLNLGWLYDSMFEYDKAAPFTQEALEMNVRLFGEDSENTALAYGNAASQFAGTGRFTKAKELYRKALTIRERVHGPDHEETAVALSDLGWVLQEMGEFSEGERLCKRALRILDDHSQETDVTITTLDTLGWIYDRTADYVSAEAVFTRSLEICKRLHGISDERTADCRFSLGSALGSIGEFTRAEEELRESLRLRKQILGARSAAVGDCCINLAWLFSRMEDYQQAESFVREGVEIYTEILGRDHPTTAIAVTNLAEIHQKNGQLKKAEELLLESLAVNQTTYGEKHVRCAEVFSALGTLYHIMGEPDKARDALEESLRLNLRFFDGDNPAIADDQNTLSVVHATAGDFRRATQLREVSRRAVRTHMTRTLPGLSEKSQQRYLSANFRPGFTAALSYGLHQKDDARTAILSAGWLLNGKGMAQEVLAEAALLSGEEAAELVNELRDVRDQIARLTVQKADTAEEKRRIALANLETRQQKLQRQIAEHGLGLSDGAPWISASALKGQLPFDSVFINVARFGVADITSLENNRSPAKYVAWVIPAAGAGDIRVVDLGLADPIDELVAELRGRIQQSIEKLEEADNESVVEEDFRTAVAAVSAKVLQPLENAIQGADEVIFSPDGALWLLPWNALLMSDGSYLVEHHRTRYVLSGRELMNTQVERAAVSPPVMFADPDYNLASNAMEQSQTADQFRLRSAGGTVFRRLQESAVEAASIKPSLEEYVRLGAKVLLQDEAQEAVFKNLHRPRVLLMSTHGFFQQPQESSSSLDGDSSAYGNPLLRCGLALAGCNNLEASQTAEKEDGILTGLEIIGTDLRGTELVVLSACETGLGDIRNGEGVAGLRQAFQLAGAQSVVSSLWQVADKETARLMSRFFKNLADGMNKSEALRQAQLARIEARRKRNGGAHPFFWAAFTLTGQQ